MGTVTGKRILLADDDEYWRARLKAALVEQGYVVTVVQNGREARRWLEVQTFDALVIDNQMETADAGLRVLEWQRMRGNRTPAILHSSELLYIFEDRLRSIEGIYVRKARNYTDDALVEALGKLFS